MKIALLALCVVLPSICVCTPLPDYSVASTSNSGASATGNGGNVSVNSNSSSGVTVTQPPAVPPTSTVPPTPATPPTSPPTSPQPPCTGGDNPPAQPGGTKVDVSSNSSADVNQQGDGSVSANASSSASASVSASGNKCGKPDCDEYSKYSVLVKNQEDVKKFSSINWMLWKSSSSSTTQSDVCVCAPRHLDQACKASQYKITVESETDIFYEVWGYNGEKVLYIKQKLSITSQQFHIYTSQVVSVAEAANGSKEVIAVQNEQSVKQYFDNGSFAILDSDYETYMICTTSGKESVTFISVSQQVYESTEMRQQVTQKIDQVLKTNNLSSSSFIEVTSKFDVDITQYQWDKCSQGGNGNNGGGSGSTNVEADANSSANVNVNNGGNGGSPGSSPGGNTDVKAGAESKANVDVQNKNGGGNPSDDKTEVKAGADSKANVDVQNNGGNGPSSGGSNVHADANSHADASVNGKGSGNGNNGGGSCSGGSGKPTQQGFTNYSVLKISSEEFQKKIDKTTWYVAKYTKSQEEIKSDVTVCADRYVCSSCKAVKFQYTCKDGKVIFKEWGYDGQNLIYIQEEITFVTQDFVILKAEVKNVMKATKDTDVAVKNENSDQVKTYLSSEYAVLYTDYEHVFIGQTSSEKGAITFVAFIQEIYECEEKQQQYAEQITKVLKESGIDESSLQKLTAKFDVDTNKYNKVESETKTSDDGKTTETKQETEGKNGKTTTETKVSNGPSPPSGGTDVNANASSNSNVNVHQDNNGGTPPAGGTDINASASSDANVNVNQGGNNTPPPCDNTPPPSSPPSTPPSSPPSTPSSINANASSDSNVTVDNTGGPASVSAGSNSDASVTTANP